MTTVNNYNYFGVAVDVTDNRGKWETDKPITGVIAQFDSTKNSLSLVVPEVQKRDTTKNPALFKGELTGMELTVRKDGRNGFVFNLKDGELWLVGQRKVEREFHECMTAYFAELAKRRA